LPNLSLNLSEAASMYPNHAAIRMDDAVLTYASLVMPLPGWLRCCSRMALRSVTGSA
jgi:hypothetical protein